MNRKTFQPTGIKIVVPIESTNPRQRLGSNTKLMDLGWAIRKGLVRIEMDPVLTGDSGRKTEPVRSVRYILKKMPAKNRVQPQVLTILQTLKELGGSASREKLLNTLKQRLGSKQSPSTVFSLKRKVMLDNGWLKIA